MQQLYGDETLDLWRLGQLLDHPETYGVIIERGTDPQAAAIMDAAMVILRDILKRRTIP